MFLKVTCGFIMFLKVMQFTSIIVAPPQSHTIFGLLLKCPQGKIISLTLTQGEQELGEAGWGGGEVLMQEEINPFSPNIHLQILQTDLHTFP